MKVCVVAKYTGNGSYSDPLAVYRDENLLKSDYPEAINIDECPDNVPSDSFIYVVLEVEE